MNTIRVATAVSMLLAAIVLASCAEEPAPTTTVPTTTQPGAAEPREQFGFVRSIDGETLVFDPAEFLTGEEAVAAARQAGFIGPDEMLPNDFYISNPDPADERRLTVSAGAGFVLIGFDAGGAITDAPVSFQQLTDYFSGAADTGDLYGFIAGDLPMTLTLQGDVVTAGRQMYLP